MSGPVADIVGLVGSLLMVIAYAYSNLTERLNLLLFNLLNLVGSLLLIVSLSVHFNLASMSLEIVWAIIAAYGSIKAMRRRQAA